MLAYIFSFLTRRVQQGAARHKHNMLSFALCRMLKAACGFFSIRAMINFNSAV
jgi:hypothetical protein